MLQWQDESIRWLQKLSFFYRYVPEGNMTACGTDYLSQDIRSKSYIVVYGTFVYFVPLFTIIYSYFFIVQVNNYYMISLSNIYLIDIDLRIKRNKYD